jgi:hypothetical protein
VAAAWDRLPDVERQGEDSGGGVAVGGGLGRRVEQDQGGAELQVLGGGGASGGGHARGRGTEELRDLRKTMEDLGAKSKKAKDPTVKHQQLLNQCLDGDGPKSKSVWFFKMYNFALRFIHRRAKDLQVI